MMLTIAEKYFCAVLLGLPRPIKRLFLPLLLFFCSHAACGQDIHFSQFFEAPLLRNPSLAGIFNGDVRVQGVYRDQWNSFTKAYRSGSLNAEYKMPLGTGNDFISTGLQAVFDKAGTVGLSTTMLMPAINYHKSLSNEKAMFLSLGFMGGWIRNSIDLSKITSNDQYNGGFDPTLPNGEMITAPSYSRWDANVGMSFNSSFGADQANALFIGAAYHHLHRPNNSFYRNPSVEMKPKYVFSAGIKLHIDDYQYFDIEADQSMQGSFNETIAGAIYSYKLGDDPDNPGYTLGLGAFLRWRDALIPVLKLDMHTLSVAISYDVNVSTLKTASMGRGGFELSLTYMGFLNRDNSSLEKVLCPHF